MGCKPKLSPNTNIAFRSAVSSSSHLLDINLDINPAYVEARNNMAIAFQEQGEIEKAISCYQKSLELAPDDINAYYNMGVALNALGKTHQAIDCYKKVIGINPHDADAYYNMGIALNAQGKTEQAIDCFKKTIEINPQDAVACNIIGSILRQQGKAKEAIIYFEKVLDINPANANTYFNMGITLKDLGKFEEAIYCYQKALEIDPADDDAYLNMAIAFKGKGSLAEAISCCRKAIEINPGSAEAHSTLGDAFKEQKNPDEAISCYQKALHLKPDSPKAYIDLGGAFYQNDKLEEAISCCRKALFLESEYVDAHYNLGISLEALGQIEDAIKEYNQVLRINPQHPDAAWNRSLAFLLTDNFAEGWKGYEQRIREKEWNNVYPYKYGLPHWNGSSFEGGKLFVHDEQGIGDTLQFVRYLPMAKARGGTIIFETNKSLFGLFRNFYGIDMLVERRSDGEPVIECDCFVPLLNIPGIFETTLSTIPAKVPYLHADPQKVRYWRNRLEGPEFKVGLVWRGNPNHKKDHSRSCALEYFAPLGLISGIRLYGLQKGETSSGEGKLSEKMRLTNLGEELHDFSDTAALIENLDLVISVDTAVAHLSGAMGKQVWTLLPFVPDWRWRLYREDSPWYPTMRLFRQSGRGDWSSVFRNVENELRTLISAGKHQ